MLSRPSFVPVRRCSSALNQWIHGECAEIARLSDGDMEFKTGHMARFASGSCTVTYKDSTVLATVVTKPSSAPLNEKMLSVDFLQSASAVGRIPLNYLRRELSQSDMDILTSRVIDRSLRPIYPNGLPNVTKVVCKPLAVNRGGDMSVLGINAASCGLALSNVPFVETVGASRVAVLDGKVVLNPPHSVLEHSDMNLLFSGTKTRKVLMIEMDGKEIDLDTFMNCIDEGFGDIDKVVDAIDALQSRNPVEKAELADLFSNSEAELIDRLLETTAHRLEYILTDQTLLKSSRDSAISAFKAQVVEQVGDKSNPAAVSAIFDLIVKHTMRKLVRETGVRVDGRQVDEFRPIHIQTDLYPRLHGSAIFQRGQSQVMGTVTFDSPQSAFRPDAIAQLLGAQQKKSFLLHYEFPQFAVNQVADSGGRFNRRALGHGTLAEKALKHVVPPAFPYCVRVDCQVLESNGSTSMASACAASLALYDAGVPLKNAVGGVAMGMFSGEGDAILPAAAAEPILLTDLMGMEDYAGDMDFKIAGSKDGFTAIQLDVSVPGLSLDLVRQSLERGRLGLDHVLQRMSAVQPSPRPQFKPCVPLLESIALKQHQRSALFRNAAFNAKLVEAETGVQVQADEDNKVLLLAPTKEDAEQAKELIKKLTEISLEEELPPFGEIQRGEVVEVLERGIRVRLPSFREPVYVPVRDLSSRIVKHTAALDVQVGMKVRLQFLGRNPSTGDIRLSMRSLKTAELPLRK